MSTKQQRDLVAAILDEHGRTFARQLGIRVASNAPSALFQLLVFALLSSARISYRAAIQAFQAVREEGWTTPQKMAGATWRQRTDTLNRSGYARYDESTSRMLGETSQLLLDKYRGDLRRLREAAGGEPSELRRLLKECKGIGDVGTDIFFREVQQVWDEVYPFADTRAIRAAEQLGLAASAQALAKLVDRDDFPRLVTGLVRVQLEGAYEEVLQAARGG